MISRIWHGWTPKAKADEYQSLLEAEILPGIAAGSAGFVGVSVLRAEEETETAFVTVTLWESLDAVREFLGEDYERSYVLPEAQALLSRYDERAAHYEMVFEWRRDA